MPRLCWLTVFAHDPCSARFGSITRSMPGVTNQLPTTILIVGLEPSFGCAASPRQLHARSLKVLLGAQHCTAYAWSSIRRRAGGVCWMLACGTICCMPDASIAAVAGIANDGLSSPMWIKASASVLLH